MSYSKREGTVLVAAMETEMGTILNKVSEMVGKRRMTVADLAREAKISYDTAKRLYYGTTERVDLHTLAGVCKALQCQVSDLFVYVDDNGGR
jgi:putative transcriptional regulator